MKAKYRVEGKMNESEGTEEIKNIPPIPLTAARPCLTVSQYELDAPLT